MAPSTTSGRLQVAVITGGHPFDVPNFHRLFRAMEDIDAYPQDFENFVQDWGGVRTTYDALVFYNMHMGKPGSDFEDAIHDLGRTAQGIVVLHHAILAWPSTPRWAEITGIADRSFGYHMGQRLRVDVADPNHPITQDLSSWEMPDETYTMADAGPDCHVLLTADHPLSMDTIAWTRTQGAARVFCFQSGHDQLTWANENVQTVLRRGILWSAGRL